MYLKMAALLKKKNDMTVNILETERGMQTERHLCRRSKMGVLEKSLAQGLERKANEPKAGDTGNLYVASDAKKWCRWS